jgi:hypothetical protein
MPLLPGHKTIVVVDQIPVTAFGVVIYVQRVRYYIDDRQVSEEDYYSVRSALH